jgi:selenide,water dikinase
MPIGQLAHVLRDIVATDTRVLVGPETFDDAGIVALAGVGDVPGDSRTCLVQTVDYFPPVVDDPYWYGAIAAANSLSDVYAMGGRPFTALNIAGIPKDFDPEWTREIFRGGFETVAKSGAVVVGGHTVQSAEAHFGFSVTGIVSKDRIAANSGAKPGDQLYLTKPLGMGAMTTAAKKRRIGWSELEPAARQMAKLNDRAAEAMNLAGAHACTDITGFGLAGHGRNIAKASGVTLRIELARVPFFAGVEQLAREGFCSGGSNRSKAALAEVVGVADGLDAARVALVFDAETSGGLLVCVPPERAATLERELAARGEAVARIGEVAPASGLHVEFA